MTPKEKAVELHDKYYQIFEKLGLDNIPNDYAKQCALICVEEIESMSCRNSKIMQGVGFWQDVRQEIEKLK